MNTQPLANPEQIVRAPNVRFTILTSRMIRLEYSPTESFEDRASQVFWQRAQPAPQFDALQISSSTASPLRLDSAQNATAHHPERSEAQSKDFTALGTGSQIEIRTEHLQLRYLVNPQGFTPRTLSITLLESGTTWQYGGNPRAQHNLRGTARTLDQADGAVRLSEGLMSRAGWAVVDDSHSLVFNADGWLEPRAASSNLDLYFFGYGHDYFACLQDFAKVAGEMPMIPRFALGNWWSRYWAYAQGELMQVVQDFRAREIPLAVCVIDMDWHLTHTGNESSGWTGYTWNRELFPEPEKFLAWLHAQGLKTSLNLHPAEGIHPHEAQYAAMAQRMGIEPATREPVAFDITNPEFIRAYFEILHHPYENDGVDFWWMDWQQGTHSKLAGLDPLYALNHLHFFDRARDGRKRPFIFSRWAGLGGFRYAIGFSGDTIVSWASLAFQPYFTATAANVAFGWWSHDIGGHWGGIEDAELYTRWVQFGVFSPILRLHSTSNPYHDRRPWAFDAETYRLTRAALRLRHALIPYLYAMAWQYHRAARPLCLPMYYAHPRADDAYHAPNQYYFGTELVAAPFVAPRDHETRLAKQSVWLPDGDWFNFFTGEYVRGGGWKNFYGDLEDVPVLAQAGAIVPLAPEVGWGGIENPRALTLYIFPGANNAFELYEDDGESLDFTRGKFCLTRFEQKWNGDELEITIQRTQGDLSLVPAQREYTIVIRGIALPVISSVSEESRSDAKRDFSSHSSTRLRMLLEITINNNASTQDAEYDAATDSLTIRGIVLKPTDELTLTLRAQISKRDRRAATLRKMLRAFRLDSRVKYRLDVDLENLLAGRSSLQRYGNDLTDAQMNALHSVISSGA